MAQLPGDTLNIMPEAINMEAYQQKVGYPAKLRHANLEGLVELRIAISKAGTYESHEVLYSAHERLLKQAEKHISMLRFNPVVIAGEATAFKVTVPLYFQLLKREDRAYAHSLEAFSNEAYTKAIRQSSIAIRKQAAHLPAYIIRAMCFLQKGKLELAQQDLIMGLSQVEAFFQWRANRGFPPSTSRFLFRTICPFIPDADPNATYFQLLSELQAHICEPIDAPIAE